MTTDPSATAPPPPVGGGSVTAPPTPGALSGLAATLTPPPPVSASFLKGVVTAVSLTGSPPTLSLHLAGDTTVTVASVRFIDSYTPVVGDTVLVAKQGSDIFALGQMNDSAGGVSNGWQTPSFGTGVSGSAQYRIVVDNGDNKVQLKGSCTLSGSPSTMWTMAAPYIPSSSRTVPVAVNSAGGVTASMTFSSGGAVTLTVDPTLTSSASGNDTTGSTTAGGTNGSDNANTDSQSGTDTGSANPAPRAGTDIQNTNHTHLYSGSNVTSGVSVDHWHDLAHIHTIGHNHTSTHSHTFTGSGHTHTQPTHTHTVAVTYPTTVYFDGIEYFT